MANVPHGGREFGLHAAQRALQLADFVVARSDDRRTQVAAGNALEVGGHRCDRLDDQARQRNPHRDANHQRQQRAGDEYRIYDVGGRLRSFETLLRARRYIAEQRLRKLVELVVERAAELHLNAFIRVEVFRFERVELRHDAFLHHRGVLGGGVGNERLPVARYRQRGKHVPLPLRFVAVLVGRGQLFRGGVGLVIGCQRFIAVLRRAATQQQLGTAGQRRAPRQIVLVHTAERVVCPV